MSDFKKQYEHLWGNIRGEKNAHEKAVGGDFDAVGYLEFQLLRSVGLQRDSSIVDVGCGSGRLASQLAPWLTGPYLGTDVLGSLLAYARELCARDDWKFVETNGFDIPAPDNSADFVVFFSVLTHISHEDSWKYILESRRVLRPGGKLIVTFLEFAIYSHWTVFENTVKDRAPQKILNQFLSRDALASFAHHGGFAIEGFMDGDKSNIPIERELVWESGAKMTGMGGLGLSTCIMVKS